MNLEQVFKGETRYSVTGQSFVDDPLANDSYNYTFFSKNRDAWKQSIIERLQLDLGFIIGFEEFLILLKKVAPFWIGNADFNKIFGLIARANENQTFYLNDFFTLLILFGKFTLNQKLTLLFDLLTSFDENFVDKTRKIICFYLKIQRMFPII